MQQLSNFFQTIFYGKCNICNKIFETDSYGLKVDSKEVCPECYFKERENRKLFRLTYSLTSYVQRYDNISEDKLVMLKDLPKTVDEILRKEHYSFNGMMIVETGYEPEMGNE